MFEKFQVQVKADLVHERTAAHFGDTTEDSFAYEVEAEKGYLGRLKVQREKIQHLYARYDMLLKDLKAKDMQIKDKDKTILSLQAKCKTLTFATQESLAFQKHNNDIKTENQTLQKALVELQESYAVLHGQYRSKEVVNSQKYDEMEQLNDQLMSKLRSLTKKYQERDQEFSFAQKELTLKFQDFRLQAKKQRQAHLSDIQALKADGLQKEEEGKILRAENRCLQERIIQLQNYVHQMALQNEEKLQHVQKQRKCQARALKSQVEHMKQLNCALQRRWSKLKEQCQLKEIQLQEMALLAEQHDKQSAQALQLLKYQYNRQKTALKEQLVHCQSHVAKLQRKMDQMARKEQNLYGKIKKFEVNIDAKRNLREIQKEELEKINLLLNLH